MSYTSKKNAQRTLREADAFLSVIHANPPGMMPVGGASGTQEANVRILSYLYDQLELKAREIRAQAYADAHDAPSKACPTVPNVATREGIETWQRHAGEHSGCTPENCPFPTQLR